MLHVEWRIKETPYVNPNVPIIRSDGTHKKGPDGKEITISVPDSDSGIFLRGSSKAQVNIWCWPIGSGEVYGYRMDEKMPPAVRAGVTPKANADKDVGEWNAFDITMKGDRLTVVLNGVTVIDERAAAGRAARGPDRAAAPRPEEGRRVDRPALARAVPQHRDQGAEVGLESACRRGSRPAPAPRPRHERRRQRRVERDRHALRPSGAASPRFFASSGERPPDTRLPPALGPLGGHEAGRPQHAQTRRNSRDP